MIWSEKLIARAVANQVLHRKCFVLIENCSWTGHECDVLAVTHDLRIIDVEVKISRPDLKADAAKAKWWMRLTPDLVGPPQLLRHPPKVWRHYFAVPKEIWKPELLDYLPSTDSGVMVFWHQRSSVTPLGMQVVRRAKPNRDAARLTHQEVMGIARLGNQRMWDALKSLEDMKRGLP